MKKQKVHLLFCHLSVHCGFGVYAACGADIQSNFSEKRNVTQHRNKVTCKRCKATKRFRKVK